MPNNSDIPISGWKPLAAKKFINELSHEITIIVVPTSNDGRRDIKVIVSGPTSVSENTYTEEEFGQLRDVLNTCWWV